MPDRLRQTLDQFIRGRKGSYYWEIETGGSRFAGGMFYNIEAARQNMIERLISRAYQGEIVKLKGAYPNA